MVLVKFINLLITNYKSTLLNLELFSKCCCYITTKKKKTEK